MKYESFAERARTLEQAIAALAPAAAELGSPRPEGQEWFDLFRNKIIAQLELPPLLIAAVVGGTNIGKSAIFNQLAGCQASAVSPLAAGTKHPVCLVPKELADESLLGRLFEQFQLHPWQSADDPLGDWPDDRLYWRVSRDLPPRLMLLDAPDVDSDVEVNWRRARAIRQSADVLLAVLTQQKYNDAAVKQFFRAAAEADKPIVVLFNQCDLKADAKFWPQWLDSFCRQTGARPLGVYVAPHDRAAADGMRLPFYAIAADGKPSPQPINLREELAALRFDEIKIRTFRGAIGRVLDRQSGLPGWLDSIRAAAAGFSAAAAALSAAELARVSWPSLPAAALVDEICRWWDGSRPPWSRRIHGFYRAVGRGAAWPVRAAWRNLSGPAADPMETFRRREAAAVVSAVEKLIEELDRLSKVGNDVLRPRLQQLLGGRSRAELLAKVEDAHRGLPAVDDDYRRFLRDELDRWRTENPRAVKFLQSLDHAAALARPAITVGLFVTGLHFAGDLVGQAAAQAAGATAGHLAAEAAIAGGITGGGEALVSTTGESVRQAAGRLFSRLQSRYTAQRAAWLAQWLQRELLGELLTQLHRGADVPRSAAFQEVEESSRLLGAP
jgi:hypothetical protein